jgi:formylmethanofuran dehydrogenase subunit E
MDIQHLLEISSRDHSHLCPRQVLGVRIGLRGMRAVNLDANIDGKRLLVITETDGCFVDGLSAATRCTVGHRTLRVEDYGKVAATFIDTETGCSMRVSPARDIREKVYQCVTNESRHYFAQMQAYQIMTDDEMFMVREVQLTASIESIVSSPGIRVICDICGEEVMNEREVQRNGLTLCRACDGKAYYTLCNHELRFCREDFGHSDHITAAKTLV